MTADHLLMVNNSKKISAFRGNPTQRVDFNRFPASLEFAKKRSGIDLAIPERLQNLEPKKQKSVGVILAL
jgi:hypothetical protein